MQKCPKCLAEQDNINSNACFYCGADMSVGLDSDSNTYTNDTESKVSDYIPEQSISLPDSDELGLESTADIMESKAYDANEANETQQNLIQNDEYQKTPLTSSQKIKRLSDSEIKEIEKNLYKSDNYINNQEKSDIIEKISNINIPNDKPFSNTPINPHRTNNNQDKSPAQTETEMPKPKSSKKGQGLAYFYKNYILIQGSQKLYTNDIVTVNEKEYILKPKDISKKIKMYAFAATLLLIVSVVGSFLAGNSNYGYGNVVGLVLDDNNQPYSDGATVIFSELGKRSNSDSQGLFSFSHIPTGSHKIDLLVNGKITGSDYITVANNTNSHITLKPKSEQAEVKITPPKKLAQKPTQKQQPKATTPKVVTTNNKPTKQIAKTTATKTKSGYGKLVLNANVDGAKLKVDGSVLGAGNLTYSKIKSGKHSYVVSLDGYKTYNGTFTIEAGKSKTLSPTLTPLTQAKKEETFKQNDYFYSASNAFNQGDYNTAIADYNKVIEESPSTVEAYFGLAESYSKLKQWDLAYENYIRAAEIHSFKKRYNQAITCYNNAENVNDKTVTAYLGRGNIYYNTGEYRAAYADFDKVVKIDKRNFDGYYGLGKTSFKLQRYTKAIKYFKDARSINSKNTLVYQYLTLAYMFDHDRKNAQKSFDKFKKYASENDKNNFKKNSQYSAVKKYIDTEK